MISVETLLYKIDQKLNKLSTNEHQMIPLEDKILWINEAQNKVLVSRFDTDGTRKLGLDSFLKTYQDMEILVESWKPITLESFEAKLHGFRGPLDKLDPAFMVYLDSYVVADKGTCADQVLHTNLVKHADLLTLFRNNHYKPSFEYQDTLVTMSSHHLEVYSDGSFTPKEARITYIRYPKAVDYAGYDHLDGSPSMTQHSELPGYLEDELVDTATLLIRAALLPSTPQNQ